MATDVHFGIRFNGLGSIYTEEILGIALSQMELNWGVDSTQASASRREKPGFMKRRGISTATK